MKRSVIEHYTSSFVLNCFLFIHKLSIAQVIPDAILLRDKLINDGCWQLQSNYATLKPAINSSDPFLVTVGVNFYRIVDMSDGNEKMSVVADLGFYWNIECAKWTDDMKWNHVSHLLIPTKEIWIPNIVHLNSIRNYFLHTGEQSISHVKIYPNGLTVWWASGLFESRCEFDFQRFPFDTQSCAIELMSWEEWQEIKLRGNKSVGNLPVNNAAKDFYFEEDKANAMKIYEKQKHYMDGFRCDQVLIVLTLKRDPSFYTSVIIIPTLALMVLQNLAFFLPICVDRCSFLITILLAISVLQGIVDSNIPHVAQRVAVSYLLLGFTIMSICTTVYSVIVLYITQSNRRIKHKRIFKGRIKLIVFADLCGFLILGSFAIIFLAIIAHWMFA